MIPGGAFRGASSPCPIDWSSYASTPEVELEVRPGAPRSMHTWSVVHDGALFVPADFLTPWKRWPYQVIEDDRVRLRIGNAVFACRAERVQDASLVDTLRRETAQKYAVDPNGRASRVEVWWFRLHP
jgi:hypothetical protein